MLESNAIPCLKLLLKFAFRLLQRVRPCQPMWKLASLFPSLWVDIATMGGCQKLNFYYMFIIFRKKFSHFRKLAKMNLMKLISLWDL